MRSPCRPKLVLPVTAVALAACLCSCRSAEQAAPVVPTAQIEALLEQKLEARALVERALALEGQAEEQKQLHLRVLELDPSLGKAHNNLGLIYLDGEDYPDAIGMLREAVKRMPGNPVPRFNLGYAYELIGRLGSAEEQYEAAARMAPEEPDYLESLARVYIRRRDHFAEAKELLERGLQVEARPEHVKWINAQLESLEKGFVP